MKTAICWDFDGTLVYSNSLWSSNLLKVIQYVSPQISINLEDIRRYNASGFTWHTPDKDFTDLIGDKWWEYMNERFKYILTELGADEKSAACAAAYLRKIITKKENYTLYEDTIDTLKTTKEKGCTNILLSNNYPELEEVMDKLELSAYFDDIVISALVGYDKPRKEIFDIAKEKCGDAQKIIMVGDSITADIIGGNNADMTTVLVHRGYSEYADYCFDNLKQIDTII